MGEGVVDGFLVAKIKGAVDVVEERGHYFFGTFIVDGGRVGGGKSAAGDREECGGCRDGASPGSFSPSGSDFRF